MLTGNSRKRGLRALSWLRIAKQLMHGLLRQKNRVQGEQGDDTTDAHCLCFGGTAHEQRLQFASKTMQNAAVRLKFDAKCCDYHLL